jgi:hypothetical protein
LRENDKTALRRASFGQRSEKKEVITKALLEQARQVMVTSSNSEDKEASERSIVYKQAKQPRTDTYSCQLAKARSPEHGQDSNMMVTHHMAGLHNQENPWPTIQYPPGKVREQPTRHAPHVTVLLMMMMYPVTPGSRPACVSLYLRMIRGKQVGSPALTIVVPRHSTIICQAALRVELRLTDQPIDTTGLPIQRGCPAASTSVDKPLRLRLRFSAPLRLARSVGST